MYTLLHLSSPAMYSLSTMPDAVISRILQFGVDRNASCKAAMKLAAVSRRFRLLAEGQPLLWTRLCTCMSWHQFVCYIDHSGQLPLSLFIRARHLRVPVDRITSDPSIRDSVRRIESIFISLTNEDYQVEEVADCLRAFVGVARGKLNQLRVVRLTTPQEYWRRAIDESACLKAFDRCHLPVISRLFVRPSSCEALRSWSHMTLTRLSLGWSETLQESFDPAAFLPFLRGLTCLYEMSLVLDLVPYDAVEPAHVRAPISLAVVLPMLEILELHIESECPCIIFSILSNMTIPNLRILRANLTSYSRSEFTDKENSRFLDHIWFLRSLWPHDWASVLIASLRDQELSGVRLWSVFEQRHVCGSPPVRPIFRAPSIARQRFLEGETQFDIKGDGFAEGDSTGYEPGFRENFGRPVDLKDAISRLA